MDKKTLTNPYFISSLVVYVILFTTKKLGYSYDSYVMNHLGDSLCLPIVLSFCLAFLNRTHGLTKISMEMIIVAWLSFSILFELILPNYSNKYTGDYLDIVWYGIGGLVFFFYQKHILLSPSIKAQS